MILSQPAPGAERLAGMRRRCDRLCAQAENPP